MDESIGTNCNTANRSVVGSNPAGPTIIFTYLLITSSLHR